MPQEVLTLGAKSLITSSITEIRSNLWELYHYFETNHASIADVVKDDVKYKTRRLTIALIERTIATVETIGGNISSISMIDIPGDVKYVYFWNLYIDSRDVEIDLGDDYTGIGYEFSMKSAIDAAKQKMSKAPYETSGFLISKVSINRPTLPEAFTGWNPEIDKKLYGECHQIENPVELYDYCMRAIYAEMHEYDKNGHHVAGWFEYEDCVPITMMDFLDPDKFKEMTTGTDPLRFGLTLG